jgi:hypothetical protein
MWAHQRTLRLADGPDEVHKRTIAAHELRRWNPHHGKRVNDPSSALTSAGTIAL